MLLVALATLQPARASAASVGDAGAPASPEEPPRAPSLEVEPGGAIEARRVIAAEQAHLRDVGDRQADLERQLGEARRALTARGELELGLRRRVQEALAASDGPDEIDALYERVHDALGDALQRLAEALDRLDRPALHVAAPGPSTLSKLPLAIDASPVEEQRKQALERSVALRERERELARDATRQLMTEVENTNHLRLALLPALSPGEREALLGVSPKGIEQAALETQQVALTLRYHVSSALHWARALRREGLSREAAWLTGEFALRLLLVVAVFWWWRRRADGLLSAAREAIEQRRRRRRDLLVRTGPLERCVILLERVRRPLELLILVRVVLALLPEEVRALLEVRVLVSILTWSLGGVLVALGIDTLSSNEIRGVRDRSGTTDTARLRLETLRLVAYAAVAFGLVLSLSDLIVGRGTIHAWVSASGWLVAAPVLFTVTAWWRPIVFERLASLDEPNAVQRWALARRSGVGSFVAAALGGLSLFVGGAFRSTQAWLSDFTLTRRLLAYLFRRDLSKQAQKHAARRYSDLPAPVFEALSPDLPGSVSFSGVAGVDDGAPSARVAAATSGVVAVVGERGAGKSTFLARLSEREPARVRLACPLGGLEELAARLRTALGIEATLSLEQLEQHLLALPPGAGFSIDDAECLIRPEMGGLRAFDRLLLLCRNTSVRCSWVLAFDHGVWRYLEAARETRSLFDEVVWMNPWREESIVQLLSERSQKLNLAPSFEHLSSDLTGEVYGLDRRDALQRTEANFYRLLWDYAAGNPGVALHFWRRSLGVDASGTLCVRLFDAPEAEHLESLPDTTVFVLRAILQLGWASRDQIASVTALPTDRVAHALRFGERRGYFDEVDGRYRVAWDWFRAVSRLLERRHLMPSVLRGRA